MDYLTTRYHDWMSLKTNLLWVYEGAVPRGGNSPADPAWNQGQKFARFPETSLAWLLLKGRVRVVHDDRVLEAGAGQWVIPRPGLRRQTFSPDMEILSVRFQAVWPDGCALFDEGLGIVFPHDRFPEMEKTARELLAIAKPYIPPDVPTRLSTVDFSLGQFIDIKIALLRFIACLAQVLIRCGVKPTRLGTRDERILHALSILDFMSLTSKPREQDLAREVGLVLSQFVRLFRAEMSMTPKRYLEIRRHDACKDLLINSSLPLKRIAMELGFSQQSDFSCWFKKHYKISPKTFRARFPEVPQL
ncbi:AraC family transcriptional regulator [Opitutaceae bacterium TAV4]|nr:AraC family transcriptional regulator [Opitutaceae bacterium TAV4]RRJ99497.1 AraC family transcriptional regulator [Opitutaceae bacterium TAV3]